MAVDMQISEVQEGMSLPLFYPAGTLDKAGA